MSKDTLADIYSQKDVLKMAGLKHVQSFPEWRRSQGLEPYKSFGGKNFYHTSQLKGIKDKSFVFTPHVSDKITHLSQFPLEDYTSAGEALKEQYWRRSRARLYALTTSYSPSLNNRAPIRHVNLKDSDSTDIIHVFHIVDMLNWCEVEPEDKVRK